MAMGECKSRYVEIGNPPSNKNVDPTMHLGAIDIATATVVTAPPIQRVGLGLVLMISLGQ
jgi:hypothetical protein